MPKRPEPRRRKRKPPPGKRSSTPEKKAAFIEELRRHGSVYHAAKAADVGRRTVYAWRDADEAFAAAWTDAHDDALDALEESLYRRGITRDTTAAIFLLKGNRGDKYRDRASHEHTGKDGGPIETAAVPWDLTKLTDEEFEALQKIRARAGAPLTNGHDHAHHNGNGTNGHAPGGVSSAH